MPLFLAWRSGCIITSPVASSQLIVLHVSTFILVVVFQDFMKFSIKSFATKSNWEKREISPSKQGFNILRNMKGKPYLLPKYFSHSRTLIQLQMLRVRDFQSFQVRQDTLSWQVEALQRVGLYVNEEGEGSEGEGGGIPESHCKCIFGHNCLSSRCVSRHQDRMPCKTICKTIVRGPLNP
jgi:hypothetical protein